MPNGWIRKYVISVESTETGPFDRYADHAQIVAHYRHVLTTRLAGLVDTLTTNTSSVENGVNKVNYSSIS